MANIIRRWKKYVACSCSHGDLISRSARHAILKFNDSYRPSRRVHLGDFLELTAFRGGARGKDEVVNLESDVAEGLKFIEDFETTDLLMGNHDVRAWETMSHPNAIMKMAAQSIVQRVKAHVAKQKINFIEEYNVRDANFIELGDTKFMHGVFFSENAVREHAEHYGRTVFGHLHKVEVRPGRRYDRPTAYCVGLLADIKLMKYADRRRATSQWQNGFSYGEFCDDACTVNIATPLPDGSWRL